jgi:hypothetical protein
MEGIKWGGAGDTNEMFFLKTLTYIYTKMSKPNEMFLNSK